MRKEIKVLNRIVPLFLIVTGMTALSFSQDLASSVTFNTLVSFNNQNSPEGAWTSGNANLTSLVQGRDGNLYGTTQAGGGGNFGFGCSGGAGTAFRMTPTGGLKTLQVFHTCPNSPEGVYPQSGITLASNGNFFGTTQQGGNNSGSGHDGTVFTLTLGGSLTTIFNFPNDFNNPPTTDGSQPVATLAQGTDGNFYGATIDGGKNTCGTIFKITAAGALTPIHDFPAPPCVEPYGTLIQAADGNFYGTTRGAGTHNAGTLYRISPSGNFSTFYNFLGSCGASCNNGPWDGQQPNSALVQGSDGNFYGTTESGGTKSSGTVFKITPSGTETVLHSFGGTAFPGSFLDSPLIQATDGNLYGVTNRGGNQSCFDGCGTIFSITPTGTLTLLHMFSGQDGAYPTGALVQYTDGSFYGMTSGGGTATGCNNGPCGTIYHFSLGLAPFVKLVSTSGKVGASITIFGNNLTGTSSVKFNGTAATFSVPSSTYILATVPKGATTGMVQVATSSGTLSSYLKFRVTPVITTFAPSSGTVGTSVVIKGESFTGATSVSFGGVKASFTINSYTAITAKVPTGAKTAKIIVTTPGGSATSSGAFTIP